MRTSPTVVMVFWYCECLRPIESLMQMDSKVVLINGANSGVGLATARQLAELGATVVIVCRDLGRGTTARNEVCRMAESAVEGSCLLSREELDIASREPDYNAIVRLEKVVEAVRARQTL